MAMTDLGIGMEAATRGLRRFCEAMEAGAGVSIEPAGSGVLATVGLPAIEVGDWVMLRDAEHVFEVTPALYDMADNWIGLVAEVRTARGRTWRAIEKKDTGEPKRC